MSTITYTEARQKLAETMARVCKDHAPVVMMSLEDYEALLETAYLLRSPRNARRLLESIHELEDGDGQEHTLAP